MKPKSKTTLLEIWFGGKWKYMGFGGGWHCDDGKRWVNKTYSFCDEDLYHGSIFPPEYYLYEKNGKSKRIMFFNDSILVF